MTLLLPVESRFWRMLSVAFQRQPLASGSHVRGGRLNPPGTAAMYLAADHSTAIVEYHQGLARPGTLAGYDIASPAIVDLRDPATVAALGGGDPDCAWRLLRDEGRPVPSWQTATAAIAAGAHGALYRSVARPDGDNLVLWHWHDSSVGGGEGAAIGLVDPHRDLG